MHKPYCKKLSNAAAFLVPLRPHWSENHERGAKRAPPGASWSREYKFGEDKVFKEGFARSRFM